jgi:predicted peptidase
MKKTKLLLFVLSFFCLIFSNLSMAQEQTAIYTSTCPHSNAYYEYLPAGYPAAGVKYPVMLFFHGSGEVGPGTAATLPTVLRNGPPKLIDTHKYRFTGQ